MCGIAGFVVEGISRTNLSVVLRDMADTIAYRGPDSEGFFETASRNSKFTVGLGHRRLSIIDLESGQQPMSNEDGSIRIVFNGEIYNFQQLRQELIERGHRFATSSDTEVIVHAYEEYGEWCVERLRGMFAFAIWDVRSEKLFLARDRFGKKPLFVYQGNNGVVFGSEVKALLAFPGVAAKVNTESVWEYLAYRYVPGPRTLFCDIYKLPPGSYAVWQNEKLAVTRYYIPPDGGKRNDVEVGSDPVGCFFQKLDEAVRIRMVSDVPFGAFLSGGVDSSAVVSLMARHSTFPIKTFSVGFRESMYSELPHARAIAVQFGSDHHELVVSEDDVMNRLPELIRFRDAPISEPSDVAIYLLSKEARGSVKMVLTGEGSDELLGGYPKHRFELFAGPYQKIPALFRRHLFEPLMHALPYRFYRAKTAISSLGLENPEERLPRWFGALSWAERAALAAFRPRRLPSTHGMQFDAEPGNSALRRILYFDQTSWLPDNLLERGDRMTMAASLEGRMPFMDHELANYVSSLPDRYRVRGMQTKWLLRKAMARVLPKHILERPKVGFRVPVNDWFQGPMRDYLLDHLTGNDSRTREYYRQDRLKQYLDEHIKGRQNHEKLLWTLLNLELWHRQYVSKG